MSAIHPWQRNQWDQLVRGMSEDRVAHALLFTGPEGLGKHEFAIHYARALLCTAPGPSAEPCGECTGCVQSQSGSHPDLTEIGVLEDKLAIGVDQIRQLGFDLSLTSQYGRYRVAIVAPADRMNANAANSLLKTLEEPGERTVLILVTAFPMRLPATVRSRCQAVRFRAPDEGQARAWLAERGADADLLELAGGAPLRALELAQALPAGTPERFRKELAEVASGRRSPYQMAADWKTQDPRLLLHMLLGLTAELIRVKSAVGDAPDRGLQSLAEGLHLDALFAYLDNMYGAARLLGKPVKLNNELILESLLTPWSEGLRRDDMPLFGN